MWQRSEVVVVKLNGDFIIWNQTYVSLNLKYMHYYSEMFMPLYVHSVCVQYLTNA